MAGNEIACAGVVRQVFHGMGGRKEIAGMGRVEGPVLLQVLWVYHKRRTPAAESLLLLLLLFLLLFLALAAALTAGLALLVMMVVIEVAPVAVLGRTRSRCQGCGCLGVQSSDGFPLDFFPVVVLVVGTTGSVELDQNRKAHHESPKEQVGPRPVGIGNRWLLKRCRRRGCCRIFDFVVAVGIIDEKKSRCQHTRREVFYSTLPQQVGSYFGWFIVAAVVAVAPRTIGRGWVGTNATLLIEGGFKQAIRKGVVFVFAVVVAIEPNCIGIELVNGRALLGRELSVVTNLIGELNFFFCF